MNRIITLIIAATLPGAALAEPADTSTRTPVDQIEWLDTGFGPSAAPVSGDFTAGAHITFIRFAAGMKTPVHTHEHDYSGIVLTGTTRHYSPGKPETETLLPPGSHWFIPGLLPHISECLPGAECVMAVVQDAAFDIKMLE